MKKLSKIVALLLAASLILTLVACGGGSTNDPNALVIFGNIGSAEGYSILDEEVLKGFKDKYGWDVQIQTASGSGYIEQLSLMIASGDYPDAALFPTTTLDAYMQVVEAGKVVPLDEYLTEENAPNLMAATEATAWEEVKPNGDKIMAIPRTSLTRNEGIKVRADWLKNIGMGDILDREFHEVTADEFKEILKRMTNDDPDGNGKNDTIGTSCWKDDATGQYGPIEFARGFYGDYGWYEYKGEDYKYMIPMYSQKTDIYKNQLQYTQDLFKAGYMSQDGPSMTKAQITDEFKAGRMAVGPDFCGHIGGSEKNLAETFGKKPEGESYVEYIWAEDANGYIAGNGYYKAMWGHYCVFNTCSDPNKFVKFCDYLLSPGVWDLAVEGKEGVTYNMVDGYRESIEVEPGQRKTGCTFTIGIVRYAGDMRNFAPTYNLEKDYPYMVDMIAEAFYVSQASKVAALDNGYTPEASTGTKFKNASSQLSKVVTEICAGSKSVDEYDKVLAKWYQDGGKDYVEQMNKYIEGTVKAGVEVQKPLSKADLSKAVAEVKVDAEAKVKKQ